MIYRNKILRKNKENYICKIINKAKIDDSVIVFTIKIPFKLVYLLKDLKTPLVLRNPAFKEFFSVSSNKVNIDVKNKTISIYIDEKQFIKINKLNINDNVLIKLPCENKEVNFDYNIKTNNKKECMLKYNIK